MFKSTPKRFLCALFFSALVGTPALLARADEIPKVCMVLDKGGKDDHSFNESAVKGFKSALKKFKISPESKFVEPRSDVQISQFFNLFATNAKCDLIIAVGFNPSSYMPKVAERFSEKKFLALDTNLESQNKNGNIRSVTFEEHEGAFLMGAIAAMKTKGTQIGFIGGMDVPLIHRFELGYTAGAQHINPEIKVIRNYVSLTGDGWNNPAKAKEMALSQYQNGVEVIFQVAAASGQGVFDAAEQLNGEGKTKHYAIGVDSNQNELNPNVILTSMVKKVGDAVFKSIDDLVKNKFIGSHIVYGLKDNGVEWALDKYNGKFFTKKEIRDINQLRDKIISGDVTVPDFYKEGRK